MCLVHCPQRGHVIRVSWLMVFTIVYIKTMRREHFDIYVNLAEVDNQHSPRDPLTMALIRALIDIIII